MCCSHHLLAAFFSIYCWQCWFGGVSVVRQGAPPGSLDTPEQYTYYVGVTSRVTANSRLIEVVSENQTPGTIHWYCFQNNVEVS